MKRNHILHIALITAAAFSAYHNILGAGFITDDFGQIVDNPHVHDLSSLPALFARGVWETPEFHGGLYRPLAFASWMLEYSVAGPNPFLYHLDNILLHVINSVLAYLLLRSLTRNGSAAFYSALLFAVHPVHAEAVGWIACRMELLYSAFALSALLLFVRNKSRPAYMLASCALFMLALLSKESALVIPIMAVLYLAVFERPGPGLPDLRFYAKAVAPLALTAIIYLIIRTAVIGMPEGTTNIYTNYQGLGSYKMFLVMSRALFEYMRLSFLPFDLRFEYVFRPPDSAMDPRVIIPWAVLALALYYFPRAGKPRGAVTFSTLWFFIALLPVSNIVPAGIVMAERALYLPSLGICFILGLGIEKMAGMSHKRPARTYAAIAVLLTICSMYALLAYDRSLFWTTFGKEQALKDLTNRVAVFPDNPVNHRLLATEYMKGGDYGPRPEEELKAAIMLAPEDPDSYVAYARLLMHRKDYASALNMLDTALALDRKPGYYVLAAEALTKLARHSDARTALDEAIRLSPDDAGLRIQMGNLLLEQGKDMEAMACFSRAAELDPANHGAYLGMAVALDSMGRHEEAKTYLKKAVSLGPDNPDLHYFMALNLAKAGDTVSASSELRIALRLRPDFREASELLDSLKSKAAGPPPERGGDGS